MNVVKAKKRWPKVALILTITAVLAAASWYWWQIREDDPEEPAVRQETEPELSLYEQFVERYYEVNLPGVEPITSPPLITGDEEADSHIRSLAEARGYRLQFVPTANTEELQGITVQPEVVEAWEQLQAAALNEGIYLGLVSGYRSTENQREIFLTQFRERAIEEQGSGYTAAQIIAGEADAVLGAVLREYSIPGYSKHHSGYIIDITDTSTDQSFEDFAETEGFHWISDNDYANALRFGFLPSYPEGVEKLGPQPEPWEYAWVGIENTRF